MHNLKIDYLLSISKFNKSYVYSKLKLFPSIKRLMNFSQEWIRYENDESESNACSKRIANFVTRRDFSRCHFIMLMASVGYFYDNSIHMILSFPILCVLLIWRINSEKILFFKIAIEYIYRMRIFDSIFAIIKYLVIFFPALWNQIFMEM